MAVTKGLFAITLMPLAMAVSGCGERPAEGDTDGKSEMMEGGGVYPTPTPSVAAETLSTEPAAAATQNASQNLAPSPLNSAKPPHGQPSNQASPAPTSAN